MAVVEIIVNGKAYQIGCDDGDRDNIIVWAKKLNHKIEKMKSLNPSFFLGLNDEKVLLFQSLLLIGDMEDIINGTASTNNGVMSEIFSQEAEEKIMEIENKINNMKKILKLN